jgi:hypothetical protein
MRLSKSSVKVVRHTVGLWKAVEKRQARRLVFNMRRLHSEKGLLLPTANSGVA